MTEILQKEEKVLRQKAKPVPVEEITTARIQDILKRMNEALANEYDGVGLAAPQIGESLRIFIISDLIFKGKEGKELRDEKTKKENLVFINPELVKVSKETKMLEEGCLSVRPLYGKVKRSTKATVRAYNEKGELFERGGSGLLAQIFQHEVDHLNGTLFIDKAKDIHEMQPEQAEDARV